MYILKIFNYYFNFCVSKLFSYSIDDTLLRKAFTDILICCDIHFTYILVFLDFAHNDMWA